MRLTYGVPLRSEVLSLEVWVSPGGREDKAGRELCWTVVRAGLAPVHTVVRDLITSNLDNIDRDVEIASGQGNQNLAEVRAVSPVLVELLSTLGVNHRHSSSTSS